jgi:RHS repeat-associated protein
MSHLPTAYSATTNSTNRLTAIGSLTPTYDNNGNLTYDTVHNFGWDAEGNMISVDSTAVTIIYDALNRAVEQQRGTSYTEVVYTPGGQKLALMNGSTLVKAFPTLPGGGTAVYAAGTTGPAFYRRMDWLGSSRLATTQARGCSSDVAYAPFGEPYNPACTSSPDLNFTGQNQDTVSGYYDFLFREYSPVQGRWLSPDPSGMAAVNPANPQTWNRYGYVANNPLALVDPQGLDWDIFGCLMDFDYPPPVCFDGGGIGPVDFGPMGAWGEGIFEGEPNLPLPTLDPNVAQMLAALFTGNWRGLLDSTLAATSQGLWSMVPNPAIMDADDPRVNGANNSTGFLTNNGMRGCTDKNSSLIDKGIQSFSLLRIGEHPIDWGVLTPGKVILTKWLAPYMSATELAFVEGASGLGTLILLGATVADGACFIPGPTAPTSDPPAWPWQQ